MKKTYMKPAMQAVKIQQCGGICASPGVKSLSNTDVFDTFEDLDEDDV